MERTGWEWVGWGVTFAVMTVGTVLFWRGGWAFLDLNLEPKGKEDSDVAINGAICLLLACTLGLLLFVTDPWLKRVAEAYPAIPHVFLFRTFALGWLSILAWRGVWIILDVLVSGSDTTQSIWAVGMNIAGFALLAALQTAASVLAPPFVAAPDGEWTPVHLFPWFKQPTPIAPIAPISASVRSGEGGEGGEGWSEEES